jgi:hypothetical protein
VQGTWTVCRTGEERFPYRVAVEQAGRTLLAVRARERWPGPGMQTFCLRDEPAVGATSAAPGELLESVPVLALRRLGRKLSIVLDRPTRKRCDFLFLTRPYKGRSGEYEQIFWRTEQAVRAHRSRSRPQLYPDAGAIEVAIDVAEKYAWAFPEGRVERRKLVAGDYAALHEGRMVAVVERKTFENLLAEIAVLQVLHGKLAELESFPHAALVVEAQYGDFLDPSRIGRWTPRRLARILAELAAMHPKLPIVYAGNRKLASEWTRAFFAAVVARLRDPSPPLIAEAVAGYERRSGAGFEESVRLAVLHDLPASFSIAQLARQFPGADAAQLRRILVALRREGVLASDGRGRGARWRRAAGEGRAAAESTPATSVVAESTPAGGAEPGKPGDAPL